MVACLRGNGAGPQASPELQRIVPPRVGSGEDGAGCLFQGAAKLKDARQVLVYEPGITVNKVVADHPTGYCLGKI